jgi:hypothetical protein
LFLSLKGKGRGIFGGKKVEKSITFCESDINKVESDK